MVANIVIILIFLAMVLIMKGRKNEKSVEIN